MKNWTLGEVLMEVWKRSPLGPDHVEVSNLGRVRTLDRIAPSVRDRQPTQLRAGRLLSPYVSAQGYPTVSVKEGGRRPKYSVHRLVAAAFCDGYRPGLSVNHIDGNKANNAATNLEWVTLETNTALAWQTGQSTPEAHASKLTAAQAGEIKELLRAGRRAPEIAERFGVSASLVYLISQGKRWASAA
jgi:hypothetical protein